MAVQEGPTGIRVSWVPPTPLGDTTGYRIYYSGGNNGSVDVRGGSRDSHLLTDLQDGASYTISIMGTSEHLPSNRMDNQNSIPLSELLQLVSVYQTYDEWWIFALSSVPLPGQLSVTVTSITATTISLSWNMSSSSLMDSYEVMWEGDGTRSSATITDGSSSYTITGLQEGSSYIITVTATSAAGSAASHPVSIVTEEEGK